MLLTLLQSIAEDIRFAFRMMKRSLGLTAMAVLSLALGIGATISIFSVIYALALRPLPVPQPDRLVELDRADGGTFTLTLNGNSFETGRIFFLTFLLTTTSIAISESRLPMDSRKFREHTFQAITSQPLALQQI